MSSHGLSSVWDLASLVVTRQHSTIHTIAATVVGETIDLRAQTSPDGAVTLLFTDVAHAEEIAEELGERRAQEVFRDYNDLVRKIVEALEGSIVKSEVDGFLIAFTSAHGGLRCAIELQRTFAGRVIAGSRHTLQPRIGLHTGHVITDDANIFGRTVVLAARIADRAHGGEILVSVSLKQYVETDPHFVFEPRGEFAFRGVAGEHTVYAVAYAGVT